MVLLPKVKLKAVVSFPATILDGTGVDVVKQNGSYQFNIAFDDFAPPVAALTDPAHQNVLLWNDTTGAYALAPASVIAGGGGPAPATAVPIVESGTGAVGTSVKYAREDHVHPLGPGGGGGSGDVVGPAGAVADRIAVFNGTTGKLIKDGGKTIAQITGGALVADTAPAGAPDGAFWWESDTGILYVRYNDGTSTQWVAIAGAAAAVTNNNVLINGDFRVNQVGYVSAAALAAGVYGHDQWKAGAGGGDYSFTQLKSSTQITIASGKSLIQPIEDVNVVGGSYVLSWTGTAQARAGVNTLTPSGSYVASPLLITGQTAGTVMSVEFNAGTLGRVKLEIGANATPFVMRPYDQELTTCQRYWRRIGGTALGDVQLQGYASGAGQPFGVSFPLAPNMRANPTVAQVGTFTNTNVNSTAFFPTANVLGWNVISIAAGTISSYGNIGSITLDARL